MKILTTLALMVVTLSLFNAVYAAVPPDKGYKRMTQKLIVERKDDFADYLSTERAKAVALARLGDTSATKVTLQFVEEQLKRARDLMAPAKNARALIAGFAAAKAITIPDCGHALMAEQPDAVLDALRGFLLAPNPATWSSSRPTDAARRRSFPSWRRRASPRPGC